MNSRVMGIGQETHNYLKELSNERGITMKRIIDLLIAYGEENNWHQDIDWEGEKAAADSVKSTWTSVVSMVEYYQKKAPDADTNTLMNFTGYSKAQVEAVTMESHARCLKYLRDNPYTSANDLTTPCDVTLKLAKRVSRHFRGKVKPTKREAAFYQSRGLL